jgi:hypothetical protein
MSMSTCLRREDSGPNVFQTSTLRHVCRCAIERFPVGEAFFYEI